jgi:hypothetical protein
VAVTPAGGGGNKKTLAILVGVLAVIAIGVVGFLVLRGDDDSADDDRRDRTERDDDRRDDDRDDQGDPDDAVDVADEFVQALIDGDCDQAADLATASYDDEFDGVCGEAPADAEITDADLDNEDPVVVVVSVTSDEAGDEELPLEMSYEDGDWLVDGFYFEVDDGPIDEPSTDEPTTDSPGASEVPDEDTLPSSSDDPEELAEQAIQAVIDGDCEIALSLGTLEFIEAHGEEVCSGELLPPDATITGVETISESPVTVSVDVDAGGDSFGIELTFVEEFGTLLIDSYTY